MYHSDATGHSSLNVASVAETIEYTSINAHQVIRHKVISFWVDRRPSGAENTVGGASIIPMATFLEPSNALDFDYYLIIKVWFKKREKDPRMNVTV